MSANVRPVTDLLWLCIGPGLWFAHFAALYGAEALLCTPPAGSGRVMLWIGAIVTLAVLAALACFAARLTRHDLSEDRPDEHTGAAWLRRVALLLALLSAIGVIWSAFPVAFLAACATPIP